MYRVIFGGSGQWWGPFDTLAEAERHLHHSDDRVQRYMGEGEWETLRRKRK
ncbi:MAG: hypothetical protein UY96_C0003G0079 [Parcubacteria group bacterium GW2011_GWB1_56_8]|nr:MAG: hypothetical protein UY96_C0003G0079 [Parcubacteria group bacterium GW2011_GWB1_56_8]